jgi:hypothetical protein
MIRFRRRRGSVIWFIVAAFISLTAKPCPAQTQDPSAAEFWPTFNANFELSERISLRGYVERYNGEDGNLRERKIGASFSYRRKRILKKHQPDVDEDNEFNLVVGAGYEFVQTDQGDSNKHQHVMILHATPRYIIGGNLLLQDRNRLEFQFPEGTYNFRYRNKLSIQRPFRINNFRLTPYISGELFWDRNRDSWNKNRYAFGWQFPFRKSFMLDTYYQRENCTTCGLNHLNIFGLTFNLYFWRKN